MAKAIHTLDGDYYADDASSVMQQPRTMDEQPATTATKTEPGFIDRIRAAILAAYPTKSQDANWLNQQVSYYAAKQGTEGKDDDYWIKRASGWQAGPQDQAEVGEFASPQGTGSTGFDWDAAELAPPDPYTTPERPSYLQGEFTLPEFSETFQAPTEQEYLSSPGAQAELAATQQALERSAAARGSILSGGFVGRALPRAIAERTSQGYADYYGRKMNEYEGKRTTYRDRLNALLGARGVNESAYGTDVANYGNQYNTRYLGYRDAVGDQKWLAEMGLNATTAGRV